MTATIPPHQPRHTLDSTDLVVEPAESVTNAFPVVPQQRSASPAPAGPAASAPAPESVRISGLLPSPPAHKPNGRRVLIVAVAAGAIAILGIVAAVAVGMDTSSGGSDTPVAPVAAPPALSTSQMLVQWRDGGGLQHLTAITGDLTSVGNAASRYDVSGMTSACYSLQSDIEAAQAFAPVPDAQVQSSWSAALASGARSAAYCVAGTQQLDPDLINMSTTEMNDMTSHLNDATARLNSINGI